MNLKYFPYEKIRAEQDRLIAAVQSTITTKQGLVVHAPTGLGKTAASLAPALEHALEHDLVVLFLTGRHTQHDIALETARAIKERHKIELPVVDLVGKQWLCLQPNVSTLHSKAFREYCKALREDKQCHYYENLKTGEELSPVAKDTVKRLRSVSPLTTQEVKAAGQRAQLCPYEVTMLLARQARLIITDYQYIFNPGIRDMFLKRIGRTLEECIIIVDEGHNLPDRVKDLGSERLSTLMVNRALSECEKYHHEELSTKIKQIGEIIQKLALFKDDRGNFIDGAAEKYVTKESFLDEVNKVMQCEQLSEWLRRVGDTIREEQQSSSIGSIGDFLTRWEEGEDAGYTRILSRERGRNEFVTILSYRCLDPGVITHEVFENCHSSVVMSGTLTPPKMYAQLLAISEPNLLMLESPFPEENRLNIVIPKTSTKFTQRSEEMWHEIAGHIRKVSLAVPGNVAVFFPSYAILENVHRHLEQGFPKTILVEQRGMSKEEKQAFLQKFKGYASHGAVLMAVITGNFGEGIDLPGDQLKGVIVVGLPLSKPDLETDALIKYYDARVRKGWEYGYTIPAFNKTLQSAGRCIRSSTDKGVIVFLDERYDWPRYAKLFPKEWQIKTTLLYEKMITQFFSSSSG